MSDKQKFSRAAAQEVADELLKLFAPHCNEIVVAGSIRRMKPEVGDIELLYIPVFHQLASSGSDMFLKVVEHINKMGEAIKAALDAGVLAKRKNSLGHTCWGPENKLAVHVASGIPVDLFGTDQDRWWVALVIRTGGKETNLTLTKGALRLGRQLHAYGNGVTMADGTNRRAQSEEEVFALCGVPYRLPHQRP